MNNMPCKPIFIKNITKTTCRVNTQTNVAWTTLTLPKELRTRVLRESKARQDLYQPGCILSEYQSEWRACIKYRVTGWTTEGGQDGTTTGVPRMEMRLQQVAPSHEARLHPQLVARPSEYSRPYVSTEIWTYMLLLKLHCVEFELLWTCWRFVVQQFVQQTPQHIEVMEFEHVLSRLGLAIQTRVSGRMQSSRDWTSALQLWSRFGDIAVGLGFG